MEDKIKELEDRIEELERKLGEAESDASTARRRGTRVGGYLCKLAKLLQDLPEFGDPTKKSAMRDIIQATEEYL